MSAAQDWRDARSLAHAAGAAAVTAPERVDVARGAGRVLAEPLRALAALPGFDTAAMDGYAVAGSGPWQVVGRALAGAAAGAVPTQIRPGQALEIATGAPVPSGADAVVPYEAVQVRDGAVQPVGIARTHIRLTGEEARAGELLLPAGTLVTPAALALAAAAGHDELVVRARPRVAVLVTGDEVVTSGLPARGQVRDALGPSLPPMLAALGAQCSEVLAVPDAAQGLRDAVEGAPAELIVVSGSSSVGPADHLDKCLHDLGATPLVRSVHCSPGRTQSLWRLPDGRLLVGLPGNPFAAIAALLTLVTAACDGALGRPLAALRPVTFGADAAVPHGTRTKLVPVTVDGAVVTPCGHDRSAMLRGLAAADGLAVIEPDGSTSLLPLPGSAR